MGIHDVLFQSLEEHGWAVSDDLVPAALVTSLRDHAHHLWHQGSFKPAGIGRNAGATHNAQIRGDAISWLHHNDATPACAGFLAWASTLQHDLNQHFFLGLRRCELHFARYEPGRGYARHVDQHRGVQARKVSLVLYLNEAWNAGDGGELRLFAREASAQAASNTPEAQNGSEAPTTSILPVGGRLAIFLSDMPHEVLPARQTRWSLTGWFRSDDEG